ncbi:hypothetical protein HF086_006195 [Spodoptera exigua]|uniref:Uncharacterized protein n=1 Tax=Spodoptera exigua TaxID=7107 RepID=A0A922MCP5_SPOEX|nr:hypothetical protein HF086_006195 [Spodoptera exigua]
MPTLDCLKKFLKNRADLLETLEEAKINNNISKTESQVGHNTKSFTKHHTPKEPTCSICKQHHLLFSCERFRQMSIEQRIKEVEKSKVCSNCLHPGHDYKSCRGGACTKEPSKTLGIYWNTNQDTITYSTNIENSVSDNITKRKILSIIGQIFDPLGLISPSVLEAKIIMQKMWSLNLQWDNHVPHDIEVLWKKFIQSLSALKQLVIPRRVFYDSSKHIQLHIFCDASQNAYGGCVYVRSHTTKDEVYVQLLTAKCRVAPLKTLTIPRLELCAALTAVRLYKKVIDSLRNSHIISNCFFWSDSMIVLSWIKLSPYKLNAFVSHRINEIQTITHKHTWRYVPTKQNPADLISRGVTASVLINSDMWFSGPDFLRDDDSSWPTPPGHISNYSDLPETKPQTNHTNTNQCYTQIDNNSFIYNYSNFTKLTRVTAYIRRFIHNCKNKIHKDKDQVEAVIWTAADRRHLGCRERRRSSTCPLGPWTSDTAPSGT